MLRVALRTLRFRKGAFVATFLAMTFGAVIVLACGGLMETGIRTELPAQRLAAAPLVVTGGQTYELPKQNPDDPEEDTESGYAARARAARRRPRGEDRVGAGRGGGGGRRDVPGASSTAGGPPTGTAGPPPR